MPFNTSTPKQVPTKIRNFGARHSHRAGQASSLFMVNVVALVAVIAASLATFSSARAETVNTVIIQNEVAISHEIQTPEISGLKAAGFGRYTSEVGSPLLPEIKLAENQVQVEFPVSQDSGIQKSNFNFFNPQLLERLELGKFALLMALVILFGSMVMVTSMLWQMSGREWKDKDFSIRAFASEQALH